MLPFIPSVRNKANQISVRTTKLNKNKRGRGRLLTSLLYKYRLQPYLDSPQQIRRDHHWPSLLLLLISLCLIAMGTPHPQQLLTLSDVPFACPFGLSVPALALRFPESATLPLPESLLEQHHH